MAPFADRRGSQEEHMSAAQKLPPRRELPVDRSMVVLERGVALLAIAAAVLLGLAR